MEELRFSEYCANCRKSLEELEKVFFVEKEVGRCFCCEECIGEYFQPTVDFMREELAKLRSGSDFSEEDAQKLAHYQPITLEDPDEVWLQQVESGERHYTFISHFQHGEERLSYVVVCLAIEGTPSFVFIGFPTRDEDLLEEFRRGSDLRIDRENAPAESESPTVAEPSEEVFSESESTDPSPSEGDLEFDRWYSEIRSANDIPKEEFEKYQRLVEPTLDDPDEIWTFTDDEKNSWCIFIARFGVESDLDASDDEIEIDTFSMIAITNAKTMEVMFFVPTVDPTLVQHFRKGINSLNKSFGVGFSRGRAA